MSDAYRCDDCGEYDDGDPPFRLTIAPSNASVGDREIEACSKPCALGVIAEHVADSMTHYYGGEVQWVQHLESDGGGE